MKAQSNLTRRVFRVLTSNRPYISRECLRRPLVPCKLHTPQTVSLQQRRFFLEALLGTDRTPPKLHGERPTGKNLDVAVTKLADLLRARRSRSRTPDHDKLVDAIRFLVSARLDQGQPLTRNEVFLLTETYKHLDERDWVLSEHIDCLNEDDLLSTLSTLTIYDSTAEYRFDARALAELIIASFRKRASLSTQAEYAYIKILAANGSASTAKDMALADQNLQDQDLFAYVLKGLIAEALYSEFWSTLHSWMASHGGLTQFMHQELVIALLKADKSFDADRIYDMPIVDANSPSTECIRQSLEAAISSGKTASAEEMAALLTSRIDEPNVINTLILHYTSTHPNLDGLSAYIFNLLNSGRRYDLDIKPLNDIIEYAIDHGYPVLAHAVHDIVIAEGFNPDAKNIALRLDQALDDFQSLHKAPDLLDALGTRVPPDDNYDIKVLNKYITKLSSGSEKNHENMMRVADRILERGGDFNVEAIAGMCRAFLQKGEMDDAIGLLRYRTDFLPIPDRARISNVFTDFILNAKINDQQAFNAYELFRVAFPETSAKDRIPIMQHFFDRKRPDLACQVFSHMRQAAPQDFARPDAQAYSKCFEGIAQCRDLDGLQSVYNMLKLDLQVDLTTRIRNSIMLCQIACQTPWKAIIDHFYKIMDSREGPSYSSFEVALRACETWPPNGSFEARKIIAIMQSWNLEITKALYDNYVGVMAGQCEFDSAVELIENMEKDIGVPPDAFTLGTFYNVIPWQFRKDAVEKWAKQAYPELWEELLTSGDEIDEEWEVRYFKIDRSIDIDDPLLFGNGQYKPELQREVQAQIEPLPMTKSVPS